MAIRRIKSLFLLYLLAITRILAVGQSDSNNPVFHPDHDRIVNGNNEIDFISDTQQPMTLEELKLHPNHNTRATSLLLADILRQRPRALYMLGDIVAVGSRNHKWAAMDRFLDSCKKNDIAVHTAYWGTTMSYGAGKKVKSTFSIDFRIM